jgi:ABC-type maltose transport system permease subunit
LAGKTGRIPLGFGLFVAGTSLRMLPMWALFMVFREREDDGDTAQAVRRSIPASKDFRAAVLGLG